MDPHYKSLAKHKLLTLLRTELLLALLLLASSGLFAQTTYYSRANGNWNSSGTWSTVNFGNPTNTGTFPVAGDIVLIGGVGFTVNIVGVPAACASIDIADNSSLNVGQGLTVSGATTIGSGASGSLLISSSSGSKIFGGLVTVNSGALWNETASDRIDFYGGITNNGTFTANSGEHRFITNSQALTGIFSISRITIVGAYTVLTNNNNLTVSTALVGSGHLVQSTNAVLNIGGPSTINNMSASAFGNTVNYSGVAQSVYNIDYYNLTLSGSGVKSLQTGTTSIAGNLTLSGTVSTTAVRALAIGGSVNIGAGTSLTAGAFTHTVGGNWTKTGTFVNSGGSINLNGGAQIITGSTTTFNDLQLTGGGTKTINTSVTISGIFSIANGVVANMSNLNTHSANSLLLGGAIQGAGTWGSSSSIATNQNDTFFSGNGVITVIAGATSYYSIASGNWNTNTTWSTTGFGGGPAASTPGLNDFVFIGGGRTVTVTGAEQCSALSFDAGTSVTNTLTIGLGTSLSVTGAITIPRTVTSGANILNVGAGSLTSASLSFTTTGGGAGHQLSISTGTATISGNISGIGPSSTVSFSGAGLLRVGGSMFTSSNGTLTTVSGSTVEYTGGAQTIQTLGYNNLTLSGSGNKSLAGGITVGGNLSVNAGTTFTVGAVNLTVNGLTTVGGTLSFPSISSAKTFIGLITVTGVWNNSTEDIIVQGGITNTGTFTAGTGTYTFTGSSQALSGVFTLPSVIVNGVILTNNNTLTIGNSLAGSGNLAQASGAILNLGGSSTITNMTATAIGNSVNYLGGAQNIHSNDYNHLALSGSGVKTFQSGTTAIAGNLTFSGTVSSTAVRGLAIGGSLTIGAGTSFTAGAFIHSVAGGLTNSGTFNGTGCTLNLNGSVQNVTGTSFTVNDLQLSGSGIKTLGVSTTITGTFSISNGVVANLNNTNTYTANVLTLGGMIQVAGTWGSTSSAATNQNDVFFSGTGLVTVASSGFTYYSIASGDWSVNTTWSTSGYGGAPATSTPAAGDFVNIGGGFTVTVTGSETCEALFFDAGTSVTNTLTINNSLTVSGTVTIPQTMTSGINILNVGVGSLTAGNLNFTATSGGAGHRMTISTGTATITGNVSGIGPSSTIIFSGTGLLRLGGSMFSSSNGTLTPFLGSTVEYNGGTQTVQALSYSNLTLTGAGTKTLGLTTTNMTGNLSVGIGTSFIVGAVNLTVNGSTTVNGTLSITSNTGTKIFVGLLSVNGTWSNSTESVTLNGGITNSGTFTAGTGIYTFNTNSQTLTGTLSIPRVTVAGGALVLTNSNNLTISTSLAGTGRLTQASNATLNIGGSSTISNMTATAIGNTVNYSGTAQTVNSNNYHNLILSGSGVKNLQVGTTTISGNLTMAGTTSTTAVIGLSIGGSLNIGAGTSFIAGGFTHNVAGNWINNGTFAGGSGTINLNGTAQTTTGTTTFNNLTLSGSGIKTLPVGTASIGGNLTTSGTASLISGGALTIGGSVSIGSGSLFTGGAFTHNVGGNWTNNGTFIASGSTINFNGAAGQNIAGSSSFNNINVNSAGLVSITAPQQLVGNLSLGATSSFDAGTGLLTLVSSSDTQSASIGEIQSGANFNGSIVVQRFMGAEGPVNRYVGSPVSGALLSDLISNYAIVNNRAQTYNEPAPGKINNGYVNVSPNSTLVSGKGYLVKPTAAFANSDITWDVTGPLTIGSSQKDVNLNPTFTNNGFSDDGWNLVGNPYPSAIIWDGNLANWDIQDLEPVVYVPDIANPSYFMSFDYSTGLGVPGLGTLAGGVIALGQAFWVKAQGPALNPTLIVHESAKTSASGEFYRRAPKENHGLSITLSDKIGKDVSWLMKKPDALNGYDAKYDRSKLEAPVISISFLVDNRKLVNSTVHELGNLDIPLTIKVNTAGEFSLNFEEVGTLPEFGDLFLIDREIGNAHKISSGAYSFTTNGGSEISDRFFLSRNEENSSGTQPTINMYPNPVIDLLTIHVYAEQQAKATVIDASGALLMEGSLDRSANNLQTITFDMKGLAKGFYLIRTQVGGKSVTKKIVKN